MSGNNSEIIAALKERFPMHYEILIQQIYIKQLEREIQSLKKSAVE